MANSKISALSSASTPLAGTETLPVVQSSATVKVTVANLTAGRSVSAADYVMSTGNLVPSTAAKGINFTANTPAAGMTSQLLNWYEEGTWTPSDGSGAGLVFTITGTSTYTKIGRLVTAICDVTYPITANGNTTLVSGLPFTTASAPSGVASIGYTDYGAWITANPQGSGTGFRFVGATGFLTNVNVSAKRFQVCITYIV